MNFAKAALILLPSALLMACSQPASVTDADEIAATSAEASAGWVGLDDFVDQHPITSGLFDDSPIAPAIRELLGDRLDVLKANMETAVPLQRDGELLSTTGNRYAEGGSDVAYIVIDPSAQALEVGLSEDGKLETYATEGADLSHPQDVTTLIANLQD